LALKKVVAEVEGGTRTRIGRVSDTPALRAGFKGWAVTLAPNNWIILAASDAGTRMETITLPTGADWT